MPVRALGSCLVGTQGRATGVQVFDKATVARGQGKLTQIVDGTPLHCGVFNTDGSSVELGRHELDYKWRAWIGDREYRPSNLRRSDSEFFHQFSLRCLEHRLSRFKLSTGKLPEPTVSFGERTLAHQVAIGFTDNRGEDSNWLNVGSAHFAFAGRGTHPSQEHEGGAPLVLLGREPSRQT